ncbi:MAG: hypothetical protein QM831_11850 [Kofleriaceae bacterium]
MTSRDEGWICSDADLWNDLMGSDAERRELALRILDTAVDLAALRAGSTDNVFETTWQEIFSRAQLRWDIVAGDFERQLAAEKLSDLVEQLEALDLSCTCVVRRRGVVDRANKRAGAFIERRLMEMSHG